MLSEPREQPVKVLGPLPIASKIANDKNDFLSIVQLLCGEDRTVDCHSISNRIELEALMEKKAKEYDQIVLRFPRSAGGMSTEVISSAFILGKQKQFKKFLN